MSNTPDDELGFITCEGCAALHERLAEIKDHLQRANATADLALRHRDVAEAALAKARAGQEKDCG
jgi:hypothetical protein